MEKALEESIEKLHDLFDSTDLETEAKKIQQKMEEATTRVPCGPWRTAFSQFCWPRAPRGSVPRSC